MMNVQEQIPTSLSNLGDLLRAIEKESGQPSQLVITIGDVQYLVGDLTKRAGGYIIEMDDEYKPVQFEDGKMENPHKGMAGAYSSFDALKQAIKAANPNTENSIEDFYNGVHLIGSPKNGYSIGVPGISLGSAGGQTYIPIGRVIFPSLQDDEAVLIDRV